MTETDYQPHPLRRQIRRQKGFKMIDGSVNCSRPHNWIDRFDHWGNPFTIVSFKKYVMKQDSTENEVRAAVVEAYEIWLNEYPDSSVYNSQLIRQWRWMQNHRHELMGRLLYCSCALNQPCHVDVLARWANPWELAPLDECIADYPKDTAIIRYRAKDGYVENWAISAKLGKDDEQTLRTHLEKHKPEALFLDWRIH